MAEQKTPLRLSPLNMLHLFFLCIIPSSVASLISKFITESNSILKTLIPPFSVLHHHDRNPNLDHADHGDDVALIMEKLGLQVDPEEEETNMKKMNMEEIPRIFEEREPSIEELKAAFEVFDENKDGFIDASELKRVLEILGVEDGIELGDCERMIRVFDVNGDDRIDADEFLGFMGKKLC